MMNRYRLALIAIFVCAAFFCQPVAAKEDTAQITLKKTAVSKQNVHKYTIKKGDVVSAIIRRIPGITEADIPDNYRIIKELNPHIADLNKLYAGQILVIPGKSKDADAEKKEQAAPSSSTVPAVPGGIQTYTVKKGDSLIKIIHRELNIPESKTETIKALSAIKSINPQIVNVDRIYTGQMIRIPGKTVLVKDSVGEKTAEQTIETAESQQPGKIIEVKEKKSMPPEARLAVVKQIITQMNGSVTLAGKYYLPLPQTGQVTFDCSKIPVLEFDDKTTVFLDLENRINQSLKKMISDNWPNFHVVNVDKNDDFISLLEKAIIPTNIYTMKKRETPLTIGSLPPVEVIVDWVITKKIADQKYLPIHALRLVPENNSLLPKAIKNYAQKNGLTITEIDEETGLAGKPEEIYALSPLPVFPTTSAKDFSQALLAYLGFKAEKNRDIKVFDMVKDGFNLSIQADLLLKSADKQYVIYSRNMPPQFAKMLKAAGNELIFVADADSPKITMEKILRGLGIPYASGYFTFSGVDRNSAPYLLGFSGTKIKNEKDHYIINFDLDQGLRGLLGESWSAHIARY